MTISRILKVLPAGACALALAACGKSTTQQSYDIPEDAPKIDPKKLNAPATSLRLADQAYAKGQYAMAAQLYFRAAELQPDKTDVMIKLGYALFKAGSPADAEKIFRAALEQNAKQADALRGLAHALVTQGRAGEAVAVYRQALAVSPEDVRIHAGLGAALDMIGKHDEARVAYQAGLKLAPEDFGLKNNLALSYAMTGQADRAKSILSGIGQKDPGAANRANLSLSTVNNLVAKARPAKKEQVAEVKPQAKPAANPAARLDTPEAPERDVAEVPPPRRVAAAPAGPSRKANADFAGADSGDGELYIVTGRSVAVHAEAPKKSVPAGAPIAALSTPSGADTPDAAAAEVLDLLQQAERGPRFVWQEARRPDQS